MNFAYLQQLLDRLQTKLLVVPTGIWLAALFIPVVLALFSKRSIPLLGSALSAGIAALVMLKPNSSMFILATGAYVGSFLVAIFGIQLRRNESAVQAELKKLRSSVNAVMEEGDRRFTAELKERDKLPPT